MTKDPLVFLRQELPRLYHEAVDALRSEADGGDDAARKALADTEQAVGVARLALDGNGGGEVFLAVQGGEMTPHDTAPSDVPLRLAAAAPADAARAALEELDSLGVFDEPQPATGLAMLVSADTQELLDGHELRFHLTVADLPTDPAEVTLRVSLGGGEPPAKPAFTATVSYDDLEDVANGDMSPERLVGRLRVRGEAEDALSLAMTLAKRRAGR